MLRAPVTLAAKTALSKNSPPIEDLKALSIDMVGRI